MQRALLAFRPNEAEADWALQARLESVVPEQWYEIHQHNNIVYMRYGDRGRFATERPAECAGQDLTIISGPTGRVTVLRDFLDKLVRKLDERDPRARQFKAQALPKMAPLFQMDAPHFEAQEIGRLLAAYVENRRQQAPLKPFFEQFAIALRSRFLAFELHGALVGGLLLLLRVCELAAPAELFDFPIVEGGRPVQIGGIKFFVEACLQQMITHKSGPRWLLKAGEQLQAEGERFHEEAERADSIGQFYGKLYESLPLLLAAYRGFEFLRRHPGANNQEQIRVSRNVCDERLATAGAAVWIEFENSLDNRDLLIHRNLIEQERQQGGEVAAQRRASQFIRYCLYYPHFFEPFLLGKTGSLTLRRPTSELAVSFTLGSAPNGDETHLGPELTIRDALRTYLERTMRES